MANEFETKTAVLSEQDVAVATQNLTKVYGQKKVVDNVSMTVARGEIYGFIGNNGAGKTTVLRMLAGLAAPTSGTMSLWGSSDKKKLQEARHKSGMLIESPSIYLNMTAAENLKMRSTQIGTNSDIPKILDTVGLRHVGTKIVKNFSLGMKQRLAIGMAIMGKPELLLLDEPINGLDPEGIYEVRELLKFLNEKHGVTIIISSHILGELAKLATSYGVIREGLLVAELSRADVAVHGRPYLRFVVDNPERAAKVFDALKITEYKRLENNVINVYGHVDEMPQINMALAKNNVLVLSGSFVQSDLEGYFMQLMGMGGYYHG